MKKKPRPTSVQFLNDTHCGSASGLTTQPKNEVQRRLLTYYEETIDAFGTKPDILVCLGDLVDGPQPKGGDLTEPDLNKQDMLAVELVKMWGARKVFCVSGTAFHTGVQVQHEANICNLLNEGGTPTTFHHLLDLEVAGWFRLNCRHYVGRSNSPHGRHSAPGLNKAWGVIGAYLNKRAAAHLSVRGHVHYFGWAEDNLGAVCTLPAWQAAGGRYPDEICQGTVDIGSVRLTVGATEQEGWSWQKQLYLAELTDRTIRVAAA